MTKNNRKRELRRRERVAREGGVVGEVTAFGQTLDVTAQRGLDDIASRAKTYRNNPRPSQAGFVAEPDHAATFNARAALDRSGARAKLQPNGHRGDIRIEDRGATVAQAEVKYHGTARHSEQAARGYGDQQRVVPKEQLDEVRRLARQKAKIEGMSDKPTRQAVGREHAEVAEHATDRISDGKRSSTPRSRDEVKDLARRAEKGKLSSDDVLPSPLETMGRAALSGAKAGAVFGAGISGAVSTVGNVCAVMDGRKDLGEAALDTGIAVAKGTADGALKGAVGSAVRAGATQVAGRVASPVAKSLLKSGGPAAVAVGGVELAKDVILWGAGEIDGDELGARAVKTTATTAAGWGGAELGAVIGTALCPGVGTVVGGIVGGIAGAMGVGALFG